MHKNITKAKLREGGTVLGTCLTEFVEPEIVPVIKAAGLEFFFLDTEHSPASYRDVERLVRVAVAADVTPLVRVAQTEPFLIARTLDVGAHGIVAPRILSVEQARGVVAAMKFTPEGQRGYGLRGIINDYAYQGAQGEMESSNRETMVILQVEAKECVDAIYDMMAIPGVDATMVGPFDLSISLGIPGDFESPIFWDAFDRMVDACDKNGVAPGVHSANAAWLQRAQEHGARFLVFGSDVSVLLGGWKAAREKFALGQAVAGKSGYV